MSDPLPPTTPSTPTPNSSRPPESSGLAIASLILGILSLVCFGLFSGIPAIICGKIGRTKIRNSAGSLTGSGFATAGIITGAIGTILSILAIGVFVALPFFTRGMASKASASYQLACHNNLMQIDGAKQQWALETKAAANATPNWNDIKKYCGRANGGEILHCPLGGTYTLGDLQSAPTCSIPGHTIEQ
jgi:Domain of unknown function (DUF4190)